jgi:hypothetical protein
MVAVNEFSWEEVSSPDFDSRTVWRSAVAEIAAKAHEKLPECNGRIDAAVKIVLAGDVELLPDGKAKVASQSNGTTAYHVVNGHCDCRDFERAPGQLCKHRLAFGLARRAQELVRAKLHAASNGQAAAAPDPAPALAEPEAQSPAPTAPLPEALVSITLKATLNGHEVMVTLRGVDFASVKVQVEQASQWLHAQAPAQPPTQPPSQGTTQPAHHDSPYCHAHNAVLKRYERNGQVWYSHKLANGQWCRGK